MSFMIEALNEFKKQGIYTEETIRKADALKYESNVLTSILRLIGEFILRLSERKELDRVYSIHMGYWIRQYVRVWNAIYYSIPVVKAYIRIVVVPMITVVKPACKALYSTFEILNKGFKLFPSTIRIWKKTEKEVQKLQQEEIEQIEEILNPVEKILEFEITRLSVQAKGVVSADVMRNTEFYVLLSSTTGKNKMFENNTEISAVIKKWKEANEKG